MPFTLLSRLSDAEFNQVIADQRREVIAGELAQLGRRAAFESLLVRRAQRRLAELNLAIGDTCLFTESGEIMVRFAGLDVDHCQVRVWLARRDNAGEWLQPQAYEEEALELVKTLPKN